MFILIQLEIEKNVANLKGIRDLKNVLKKITYSIYEGNGKSLKRKFDLHLFLQNIKKDLKVNTIEKIYIYKGVDENDLKRFWIDYKGKEKLENVIKYIQEYLEFDFIEFPIIIELKKKEFEMNIEVNTLMKELKNVLKEELGVDIVDEYIKIFPENDNDKCMEESKPKKEVTKNHRCSGNCKNCKLKENYDESKEEINKILNDKEEPTEKDKKENQKDIEINRKIEYLLHSGSLDFNEAIKILDELQKDFKLTSKSEDIEYKNSKIVKKHIERDFEYGDYTLNVYFETSTDDIYAKASMEIVYGEYLRIVTTQEVENSKSFISYLLSKKDSDENIY